MSNSRVSTMASACALPSLMFLGRPSASRIGFAAACTSPEADARRPTVGPRQMRRPATIRRRCSVMGRSSSGLSTSDMRSSRCGSLSWSAATKGAGARYMQRMRTINEAARRPASEIAEMPACRVFTCAVAVGDRGGWRGRGGAAAATVNAAARRGPGRGGGVRT